MMMMMQSTKGKDGRQKHNASSKDNRKQTCITFGRTLRVFAMRKRMREKDSLTLFSCFLVLFSFSPDDDASAATATTDPRLLL
jgi:hypothetical protein